MINYEEAEPCEKCNSEAAGLSDGLDMELTLDEYGKLIEESTPENFVGVTFGGNRVFLRDDLPGSKWAINRLKELRRNV